MTAEADGLPVHFQAATQSFASNAGGAAAAIDGNPLTSWSVNGGQGKSHSAVFILERAAPQREAALHRDAVRVLLRARAGTIPNLGHRRPRAADRRVLPPEIDDLLALPAAC